MILNGRVYTVRKRVYHLIPQYHNKWSDTVRQGIITLGEGASIGGIFLNLYLEKMVYMIYLTGDTHGGMDAEKLFPENFSGEGLTKNDYVIILGDFGFIWKYNPNKAEKRWMKFFETRPWTTLFIDGNHCLSKDTELLTDKGWANIVNVYENLSDYTIATMNLQTKAIEFENVSIKHKTFKDKAVVVESTDTKQVVSLDHDVVICDKKIKAIDLLGKTIKNGDINIFGKYKTDGINISNDMIRLLVNVVADSTIVYESKYIQNSRKVRIQFKLSKERKIKHLEELLYKLKIPYTKRECKKYGINKLQPYYIRIYGNYARNIACLLNNKKEFPQYFLQFNKEQFNVFINEIGITDGCTYKTHIDLNTTSKNDANVISALCSIYMTKCTMKIASHHSGFECNKYGSKKQYLLKIFTHKELIRQYNIIPYMIDYNDYMYCFTTKNGTLVTRNGYKIAITGNCNFTRLNSYPVTQWNGGNVHIINDSVIHLMRGQVFNIEGKTFFTMGGAESYDKQYRTIGLSWWQEEIPSYSEIEEGFRNLNKHNNTVDYVLTHTSPSRFVHQMIDYADATDPTHKMLDAIEETITFKHWFYGHWHFDMQFDDKFTCLYNSIINLNKY